MKHSSLIIWKFYFIFTIFHLCCSSLPSIKLNKLKRNPNSKRATDWFRKKYALRMTSFKESLTNSLDTEYYGLVNVGTPAQQFKIMFDTGSADLWMPSSKCNENTCYSVDTYDSAKSSSYISNGFKS